MPLEETMITVPRLMAQEDAARVLGISPRWLEKDRHLGPRLPFVRVGKYIRYRSDDLQRFIESATEAAQR